MSIISMKALLESGVHFGHQTRRWNPKMKQFIFTARNGIHIIDLQKTMQRLRVAFNSMKEIAESGGKVLFVGTKKQAQAAIVEYAEKCGMFYVSERWLGGLLTNFNTVNKSIQRLKDIEKMNETDNWDAETKKEILELKRELAKKNKVLSGIKDMYKLPDAMFIIDPKRESIAVKEARKLRIPIYAVVDTNCNPDEIDFPIPGNDDAIRAIALFLGVMSRAIVEGQSSGQVDEEDLEEGARVEEDAPAEEKVDVKEDAPVEEKVDVKEDAPVEEKVDVKEDAPAEEKVDVNAKEEVKEEVKDNEKEDVSETVEADKIEEIKEEEKKDAAPVKEVKETVEADKKEESIAAEEEKKTQLSKDEPDKGGDSAGSDEVLKSENNDKEEISTEKTEEKSDI